MLMCHKPKQTDKLKVYPKKLSLYGCFLVGYIHLYITKCDSRCTSYLIRSDEILVNSISTSPRRWDSEFSDSIYYRGLRSEPHKEVYFGYVNKIHPIVRSQFCRSDEFGVPLHCNLCVKHIYFYIIRIRQNREPPPKKDEEQQRKYKHTMNVIT